MTNYELQITHYESTIKKLVELIWEGFMKVMCISWVNLL